MPVYVHDAADITELLVPHPPQTRARDDDRDGHPDPGGSRMTRVELTLVSQSQIDVDLLQYGRMQRSIRVASAATAIVLDRLAIDPEITSILISSGATARFAVTWTPICACGEH